MERERERNTHLRETHIHWLPPSLVHPGTEVWAGVGAEDRPPEEGWVIGPWKVLWVLS